MDERFPPAVYFQYSPSGVHSSPSPHHSMRYLAGLLAERQKLGPFLQVLPFSCRLLNQEIVQASGLAPNQTFVHHERIEHVTPLRLIGHPSIGGPMDLEGWSGMHTEENEYFHRTGILQASAPGWNGTAGVNTSPIIKKLIRLDILVDKYPNACKEKPRNKPGYEHLNEPLHVPVEAEFTADIVDLRLNQAVTILEVLLKPMVESMDYYKKQQLRELATLNGAERGKPSYEPQRISLQQHRNETGENRAMI